MGQLVGYSDPAPAKLEAENHPLRGMIPKMALPPLLAGARARGISDACEILGYGAILLDRNGRVLQASEKARALLEGTVRIVSEHLVGTTSSANDALTRIIAAAVAGESFAIRIDGVSGEGIAMKVLPAPVGDDEPFQLLKAVFVVSRDCI